MGPFEAAYGAQLIGCTIMRVRGLFVTQTEVNGHLAISRLTLHVGPQEDLSRPLLPQDNAYDPASQELDYMMVEPFVSPIFDTQTTVQIPGNAPATQRIIDVRARRKLEELNQSLLLRYSARSDIAIAGGVLGTYDLSVLVALP